MTLAGEADVELRATRNREEVGPTPTTGSNRCEQCEAIIAGHGKRFCSLSCANRWQGLAKPWRIGYCERCGNVFRQREIRQRFCSARCSSIGNTNGVVTKDPRHCEGCTSELTVRWKKRFCSLQCQQSHDLAARAAAVQASGTFDGVCDSDSARKRVVFFLNGHQCVICGLTEWMELPIPLVLDHIDGHHDNNRLDNLRLVCGNCDRQLPTFGSRNRGNGRKWRRDRYRKIGDGPRE